MYGIYIYIYMVYVYMVCIYIECIYIYMYNTYCAGYLGTTRWDITIGIVILNENSGRFCCSSRIHSPLRKLMGFLMRISIEFVLDKLQNFL